MTPSTSLDPAKARPNYVIEKNLGLSNGLKAVLTQLATPGVEQLARPAKVGNAVLRKILLVDDSPEIHTLVRMSFKRHPDIEIIALADPKRAVETARKEAPDLVLLDVQMTPISGKQVMRNFQAAPELSAIPVAFFTGTDDAEEKQELASLGAWQIFKKPFSPKTFSDHVISLFRER